MSDRAIKHNLWSHPFHGTEIVFIPLKKAYSSWPMLKEIWKTPQLIRKSTKERACVYTQKPPGNLFFFYPFWSCEAFWYSSLLYLLTQSSGIPSNVSFIFLKWLCCRMYLSKINPVIVLKVSPWARCPSWRTGRLQRFLGLIEKLAFVLWRTFLQCFL